jgi:hypothetical protein
MARRPLSLGRLFAIRTEEEQLVEVLRGVGPVFAIGKPGERLPLLGASRLYFEGDAWRRQVMDWFSRAALVVIRLPLRQTSGILWEISLSLSQVDHERLVFLVPRCEPDDLAWLNTILQEQHIRPLRLLPPRRRVYGSRISGIIHFSNGAEPQFVPLVRPPLLYRRYSSPLISVYRLSLGPVIERLTGESEAPRKHFGELIAKTCWSIFLIGAMLFLVAAFPKRNSYEWKSMEYQVRLNKIPGLSEAIKREHGHTLQSAGLLRLPDTDLYSIITITDRILQAAPVEACAGMAKGQALDGVWLAEVLNKIAESDSDFLSRWFDLQEKVLIEAMKAPGPPAQLAIGVAAKDLALLTDGMAPANRARYLDIDRSAADAPSSVSAEDLCWAERELFTRLRQLGETAGSRVERTLLLVMFANPSGATHGP